MADFCKQTSIELFGEDYKDIYGLCLPGMKVEVLCEECGASSVDHLGVCLGGQLCRHG